VADIEKRLDDLERDDERESTRQDLIFMVIEEDTAISKSGERYEVHREPTHYDEGKFREIGNGTRVRVDYARYAPGVDHKD